MAAIEDDIPTSSDLTTEIAAASEKPTNDLRIELRRHHRVEPPPRLSRDLLVRAIAYRMQERAHGGLGKATKRRLRSLARELETRGGTALDHGIALKLGARLVREWHGQTHTVIVLEDGFDYEGQRYRSLTRIAKQITGTHWSGPRFFGLARGPVRSTAGAEAGHG